MISSRSEDKYAFVRWLYLSAALMAVLIVFIPLPAMVRVGKWISPKGTLENKTILLFQALKVALPSLGVALLSLYAIPLRLVKSSIAKLEKLLASNWVLPVILGLSLGLNLAWILYFPTQPYADSEWYFNKATDLAQGKGYIYDHETRNPTAAWPVGYPAFLGSLFLLTGPNPWVAKVANVSLIILVVSLTYSIGKRLFTSQVALCASFLMAIVPGVIVYSSLVCSDMLFMALLLSVFTLTLRNEQSTTGSMGVVSIFLSGILNGALALTRSTGLALFPFWILVRGLTNSNTGRRSSLLVWTLSFGLGTMIVLAPWTIRNYLYFQQLIPISNNGGANFWMGNNAGAYGGFYFPRDAALNPLLPLLGDEIAVDQTGYRLGWEFIKNNPGRALRLLPAKVFYMLNSNGAGLEWNARSAISGDQNGAGDSAQTLANLVYTIIMSISVLGILCVFLRRGGNARLPYVGLVFVVYWTLLHLPFFGNDRFALPILPFMMHFAASGILVLFDEVQKR